MIQSEVQKITPQMANMYLDRGGKNRETSPRRVEKYAAAMSRGEWKLNGEPIIINGWGGILDGKHRLSAVVLSGESIEMLVVSGIATSCFNTIDQGAGRSLADIFHIRGIENDTIVASAIRIMWTFDQGTPFSMGGRRYPSMDQMETLLAENPDIHASAAFVAARVTRKGLIPQSTAALMHFYFSRLSPTDASMFCDQLLTGADLDAGSHLHMLRERLSTKSSVLKHLGAKSIAALTIKTWNAIRLDKPATGEYPMWRTGKRGEEFPVPV